jgi:carbon-monoxide dehydrogenase large subunit
VKRYVGTSRRRREDAELLTGRGQFIADVRRPGMLHAVFLRSPVPHAEVRSIDVERALAMPGVHGVITGADLPANLGAQPCNHVFDQRDTPYFALARDRVRYTGEAVAIVVAENVYQAEDARDEIDVDYEILPGVGEVEAALEPDAPRLYPGWPDNVAGVFAAEMGDVDAAFAEADVVVTERFDIGRVFACSLEGRGVVADWDPWSDELTVWSSSQVLHIARDYLAEVLGIPEHRVRVLVPRVGGGFGAKFHFYPEEAAIALASKHVGRPVRWVEDRMESFLSTVHAREQHIDASIAARADGTITAVKAEILADMGAALHTAGFGPVWLTSVMMTNVYEIPSARVSARAVVTNKTPLGSYRGWGQPQANFVVERLVDLAARELGLDGADVRRKNFVPPERFPYKSLTHIFDSGRYAYCLDAALARFEAAGWPAKLEEMRAAGRHVGVGLSFYTESTANGPSRILNAGGVLQGGYDISRVRVEPSGEVTVYTGLCEMGQGITTALTSVCAEYLGVHPDAVHVVTGDTQQVPYTGYGTGASRSAAVGGASLMKACAALQERIKYIAAHMLEAAPEDLEMLDGEISVTGSPGRSVTMADVGRAAYIRAIELPDDVDPGLEEIQVFDPTAGAWAYGTNIAVVEVDVATGKVSFLDYLFVHDCGTIINPMIVDGQIRGGVAQGIGQALYEELRYREDGQPLFGSFMDYVLPTAAEVPRVVIAHHQTPSPVVPGGVKGVGEAGAIGSPAAVVAAIEDALSAYGARITHTPVTPETILAVTALPSH